MEIFLEETRKSWMNFLVFGGDSMSDDICQWFMQLFLLINSHFLEKFSSKFCTLMLEKNFYDLVKIHEISVSPASKKFNLLEIQ